MRLMAIQFEKQIIALLAEFLKCPEESIEIDAPWAELGLDSLMGLRLIGRLSDLTGEEIDHMLMLDCSCIRELAAQLDESGIAADEARCNQENNGQFEEAKCN
jgi:acyl carrier protein